MDLQTGISSNQLGNSKTRKESKFIFLLHIRLQLHAIVQLQVPPTSARYSLCLTASTAPVVLQQYWCRKAR